MWTFLFFVESIALGVGLSMDAFSASVANGLNERCMRKGKQTLIAGAFALFQALMPLLGWLCVRTVAEKFIAFQKCVPYIALALLLFIGVKTIIDGVKEGKDECCGQTLTLGALFVQSIATSIDALSVGFTLAPYPFIKALVCVLLIATVTFALCFVGVAIGKKFGTKFSGKATVAGGIILVIIGLEIFLTGIL